MHTHEYEVETILCARVVKKTPRSKHLVWKYNVKWKGYENPEDNTWEPTESFNGSEHFIEAFWKKVDTGGRSVENLKLFKEGEELSPFESRKCAWNERGRLNKQLPSTRKPSRKSNETDKHDLPPTRSGKRKRNSVEPVETELPTTSIPTSRNSRKARREQSPLESQSRLSQDVEEGRVSLSENDSNSEEKLTSSDEKPPRYRNGKNLTPSAECTQSAEQSAFPDMPDHQTQPSNASRVPAHRIRAANPLVKMIDGDINMEGAISTKARLFAGLSSGGPHSSPSPQSQQRHQFDSLRTKSQRSTLFTAQKGKFSSLKGKQSVHNEAQGRNRPPGGDPSATSSSHHTPVLESPDEPVTASRSGELLQLAGQEGNAEDLEDYEEDVTESHTAIGGSESIFQQSPALAKGKLFPSKLTTASQSIGNAISAAWKKSTIFGPLASGSYQPQPTVHDTGGDLRSPTFILNLDVTISLPVSFITPTTPSPAGPHLVVPIHSNSPPGKFYDKESALEVLNTLRTGGPCAIVNHDPQCSETQKDIFHQFSERLSKNELACFIGFPSVIASLIYISTKFLAVAGTDVLAFCSSASLLIFHRLNFPSPLGSSPNTVLVKRVTIQDRSAYATVALKA
ncbi:hypothetical protein E1B28_008917 [Marasmius oreades]|uniref:Chromo domain-containing protein n=1 Tax=Marasmius oreades TaxID=181124 RepID=A0A9P7UUS1_9AGAR|nr:uncharacterized protein E1B28_008917 [Marasmius oreades]KAG7092569.1 hypothetical protein E1B28_008917 [Marasmius oreades]